MADLIPHAAPAPTGASHPLAWRVAKVTAGLALAGVAAWAVSGKADELAGAVSYLAHLDWGWVAVAAVAEVVSYVAFAGLQRQLLQAGQVRARLRPMTGVTFAGNAIQNTLPAGVLLSAAFCYRQYRRFGADEVLCGWVVVAMTLLSLMTLSVLAAAGLAMAVGDGSALDLVWVILLLSASMAGVVLAWTRREWFARRAVYAVRLSQRTLRRPAGDPHELVRTARRRMGAITPSRRDWAVAAGMAAANWLFDLGCLVTAFLAVNASVPWRGLLLAYAAAQLATNLPITPGGLGVVEGSLTLALVAFGGAEASTVAAVFVYRLFNFWAMLPVGWSAWGVLTWQARRDRLAAHLPPLPGPEATEIAAP